MMFQYIYECSPLGVICGLTKRASQRITQQEATLAAVQREAAMLARAHEEDMEVATQLSIHELMSRPQVRKAQHAN
jgi:hypothetical protein